MGAADYLYAESRADDAVLLHSSWITMQESSSIRLQFLDDTDGILPIDQPSYMLTVYDWGTEAELPLPGYDFCEGAWVYDGNWSMDRDILTLTTENGQTILGAVEGDPILLDVGDGWLLERYKEEE